MRNEIKTLFDASFPGLRMTDRQWSNLLPLCRIHRCAKKSVLFCQGQSTTDLFGVLSGEIEIRLLALSGDYSVMEHVGLNRIFGLTAFITGRPSTYEAAALRSTRVLSLGAPAYDYLMDHVPGFARILMREYALRHEATVKLLESSRHHTAIERLTLALNQLVAEARVERLDALGWSFVKTTQAELAILANVSRQTVNQMIRELTNQGFLKAAYGGLWICPASHN